MTTTATAPRESRLSDRAHRVLFALDLHPKGEWVETPSICNVLGLSSHEVRYALAQLREAGRVERERRPARTQDGRKTYRTFFRLADQSNGEAPA